MGHSLLIPVYFPSAHSPFLSLALPCSLSLSLSVCLKVCTAFFLLFLVVTTDYFTLSFSSLSHWHAHIDTHTHTHTHTLWAVTRQSFMLRLKRSSLVQTLGENTQPVPERGRSWRKEYFSGVSRIFPGTKWPFIRLSCSTAGPIKSHLFCKDSAISPLLF